jgi:hypothetical protein
MNHIIYQNQTKNNAHSPKKNNLIQINRIFYTNIPKIANLPPTNQYKNIQNTTTLAKLSI